MDELANSSIGQWTVFFLILEFPLFGIVIQVPSHQTQWSNAAVFAFDMRCFAMHGWKIRSTQENFQHEGEKGISLASVVQW